MKKIIFMLICLIPIVLLAACSPAPAQESTAAPSVSSPTTPSAAPVSSAQAQTSTPENSAAQSAQDTQAETTQPEETQSGSATTPAGTDELYSSYAHMISFDPDSGMAEFDYFNMLKGEDAVNWLVEQEGYSLADAQEEVANYADSEFIEKNTNPKLRTIDLNDVNLSLMYEPDGTMVEGAESVDTGIADLTALYTLDPDLLLDSFFYYVTVQNEKAVSVDQVYWP